MGWSYRKSFGSGPFRINLSKRGIGYSFGVKGARINTGPRGTYVNLSSHGISYRKKIGTNPNYIPVHSIPQDAEPVYNGIHTITSAAIQELTDTDSKDFINELREKSKKISFVAWFGIMPLVIFIFTLLIVSLKNKEIVTQSEANKTVAKINSYEGLNVRNAPSAKSKILKSVNNGEILQLLDSTNSKWLKIQYSDTIGYISKKLSVIEHQHTDKVTESEIFLINSYLGYELIGGIIYFIVLIIWLYNQDKKRLEIQLHYEMDDKMNEVYQKFSVYFSEFTRSAKIWQYLYSQGNVDYKRNAGAGKLISRIPVKSVSDNCVPLKFFKTNVQIPNIKLRNTDLYFLPERLVIKRNGDFAAVFYKHLKITSTTTRFIEDEGVPSDAKVIDHTWRYLNKNGSPDRRFNNNRQIPICAYSEYTITSDTGVYEVITTSKNGAFDNFSLFLRQVSVLQTKMEFM